jgi:superfamily II DNA or RNA helicase
MRLLFDHGTLVLAEARRDDVAELPGVLWDPRVRRFRAPAMRYGDVKAALAGRQVALSDEVCSNPLPAVGSFSAVELRPYQQAALLSWDLGRRSGVVVLPTGSGKTRVALAALALAKSRALCLVPTRALLEQWTAQLRAGYGGSIGCLGDGQRTLAAVTVATFESAYRHMPRIGNRFELLVVDEVHHFGVGLRDEALEMSIASQRLGLTATPPEGRALARLETLVGPIVYRLAIGDLTGTFLAEFDVSVVQLGLDPEERARYSTDREAFLNVYRRFSALHPGGTWDEFASAASQSGEGRRALNAWRRARKLLGFTRAKAEAVRILLARHRAARVLVFTADNEAAYAIAREALVMPITCDISRTERATALDRFKSGALRALVSARVLKEGVDVPDADVAIIVGGTQGEREHVQRVGRLLRPVPGKRAVVYELVTLATTETRAAQARRRALAATKPLSA